MSEGSDPGAIVDRHSTSPTLLLAANRRRLHTTILRPDLQHHHSYAANQRKACLAVKDAPPLKCCA